jgi:TraB/PrgY/gumN family
MTKKIEDLDPFFVEETLNHAITIKNYTSSTGETAILQGFQDRNCPIIELDDTESIDLLFLEALLDFIGDYSLDECEKDILIHLDDIENPLECGTTYVGTFQNPSSFDLAEFVNENDQSLSVIYRNRKWMPKIVSALQQGRSTAIVVGYGHLQGEKGMIQSLRERGYRVEPFLRK